MNRISVLILFLGISCAPNARKDNSTIETLTEKKTDTIQQERGIELLDLTDSSLSQLTHPISFIYNDTRNNERHLIVLGDSVSDIKIEGVLNYDFINKEEIILWKLYSLEMVDVRSNSTTVLAKNIKPEILDFDIVDEFVFLMQSQEELRLEENSCKLSWLNTSSGELASADLLNGMNFSNMDISPAKNYLAFQHQKLLSSGKDEWQSVLVLYDLNNTTSNEIYASYNLVDDIQFKFTSWASDSVLYFKENLWKPENERSKRHLGVIHSYNAATKKLKKNELQFEDGIESFDYHEGIFYVVTKNSSIFCIINGERKLIYSHSGGGYITNLKVLKK